MGLISDALLKQLLKSGTAVLIVPQGSLEEEDDTEEEDASPKRFSSAVRISPS